MICSSEFIMITDIFGITSTNIFHDMCCFFSVSFTSSPALFWTDFCIVNMCLNLLTGQSIPLFFLGPGVKVYSSKRVYICFHQESQEAITLRPLLANFSSWGYTSRPSKQNKFKLKPMRGLAYEYKVMGRLSGHPHHTGASVEQKTRLTHFPVVSAWKATPCRSQIYWTVSDCVCPPSRREFTGISVYTCVYTHSLSAGTANKTQQVLPRP